MFSGLEPRSDPVDLSGSESPGPIRTTSFDRWGFPWRPEDELGRRHAMDIAARRQQLELINRHAPAYVHTLPSNVLRLVIEARRSGDRPPFPNFLAVGEYLHRKSGRLPTIPSAQRSSMSFSSAEGGVIAIQCPDSGLYHIQSEIILAEILRVMANRPRPAKPANSSSLRSTVTPRPSSATAPATSSRLGPPVPAAAACRPSRELWAAANTCSVPGRNARPAGDRPRGDQRVDGT